jgi:hypothetical protein
VIDEDKKAMLNNGLLRIKSNVLKSAVREVAG